MKVRWKRLSEWVAVILLVVLVSGIVVALVWTHWDDIPDIEDWRMPRSHESGFRPR